MFKVRTVSTLALFPLVVVVANKRCRRAEGNAFWKGNDGKHFDCCWRWSELGRWEADLQREDLPVFHRRSIAGKLGHQQGECILATFIT